MADKFANPVEVSDVLLAFPGDIRNYLPPMSAIPDEFKGYRHTGEAGVWRQFQADWFFSGLKGQVVAKAGINKTMALRHLAVIQKSYEPQHEHKEAAVAWLASRWLSSYEPTGAS